MLTWKLRSLAVAVLASSLVGILPGCNDSSQPDPGQRLVRKLGGHTWWIEQVSWSPDGTRLAACSSDNLVLVWDVVHNYNASALQDFKGGVYACVWSPNGDYLATASSGEPEVIKIWDTANWRPIRTVNLEPSIAVLGLHIAWSPDSSYLAIGGDGVHILDVAHAEYTVKESLPGGVQAIAWSPDGTRLAFSTVENPAKGLESMVVVWDHRLAFTSSDITELSGHTSLVNSIAWSPDGKRIVSGSGDETVRVWDVTSRTSTAVFRGHGTGVSSVAWSPDGRYVASASADRTVRIWDPVTGRNVTTLQRDDAVRDISWSPDSKLLASGCADRNVYIWRVATGSSGTVTP